MSAAAVEHPCDGRPETLLDTANRLMEQHPGHRVEIIGGVITVTPPQDGPHADALTDIMVPFITSGLHGEEARVLQAVGLWLPTGSDDYAIPDLSVVDADYRDHRAGNNCYDPVAFRLVLEVTSSNYQQDLRDKVSAYASAAVPVYVIVDRKHQRVHVLTEPDTDTYGQHRVHAPGELVALPESIGAKVELDVERVLRTGDAREQA